MKQPSQPFRFDAKAAPQDRRPHSPMHTAKQRVRAFQQRQKFNFLAERTEGK